MTQDTIRFCPDIGMFAYDRSIKDSCVHATEFCTTSCFNDKLYKLYPKMYSKDIRNEAYWASITGEQVRTTLSKKRRQTKRVRLMTRGEAFSTYADIPKVVDILNQNPANLWWIPTRAWRNPLMRLLLTTHIKPLPNARLLASMDTTNTVEEWESLTLDGWSTMSFGADWATHTPQMEPMYKCPKTFYHAVGFCERCVKGCFSKERVHVHLKQH
jgi:hypothetical protein